MALAASRDQHQEIHMKFRLLLDNGAGVESPLDETALECEDEADVTSIVTNAMTQLNWVLSVGDSLHILPLDTEAVEQEQYSNYNRDVEKSIRRSR
jgi:hypothetical protein